MSGIAERLAEVLCWRSCGGFFPMPAGYRPCPRHEADADALLPVVEREIAAARGEALREAANAITSGDADHEELRRAGVDDIATLGWSNKSVELAHNSGDVWATWLRARAALSSDPDRGEGEGK